MQQQLYYLKLFIVKVDVSNKEHFQFVLKHIAYTFSDIIYGKEKRPFM